MVTAFSKSKGNAGVEKIKVEGEREKGKEVIVRHEDFSYRWRN
jgi:hypothetical protein